MKKTTCENRSFLFISSTLEFCRQRRYKLELMHLRMSRGNLLYRRRYQPDLFAFSFPLGNENYCVAGPLPGEQQSTGLLHLDLQIWRDDKKDTHRMVCVFFVINVHFGYQIEI